MALYNTWGFQQAGYIENSPQQTVLILQTISWVSGLCVFHQYLKKIKIKKHRKGIAGLKR